MRDEQIGEYLEARLIGMLLVSPARLHETTELKAQDFGNSLYWDVLQALRGVGNDIHAIVERIPDPWLGELLVHLAANESFCPENIPAYVRGIRDAASHRSFKASVGKLTVKGKTKLFGDAADANF